MQLKFQNVLILLLIMIFTGCTQDATETTHLPSKKYHYTDVNFSALNLTETLYVPVYSDIYHGSGQRRFLLTSTLSIRNTSLKETMFVNTVDYHDSAGSLIKKYLKKAIILQPLESVEFVVENNEDKGGAGANFIVDWGTNAPSLQPVIQAVMIGTGSQQGISFTTESVVVEQRKNR